MSIYRCKHCKHIGECATSDCAGTHCAQCGREVMVFDTVVFVEHMVNRYNEMARELHALKQNPDLMVVAEVTEVQHEVMPVLQQSYRASNYKKNTPVFLR